MLRWIKKRREREAEESRERGEQFAARLAAAEQEVKDNEAAMLSKACVLRDPQIGWNCLGPHCVHFHAGSVQRTRSGERRLRRVPCTDGLCVKRHQQRKD